MHDFKERGASVASDVATHRLAQKNGAMPREVVVRSVLKTRTAQAHSRVDDAFTTLNLADRSDYITFLRTHQFAYRQLITAVPPADWVYILLLQMKSLLDQDLQTLQSEQTPILRNTKPIALDPLGVGYVVCGSHFGKRVLRKRWSRSTDLRVQAAGRYLTSDALQKGWARLIAELEQCAQVADLLGGLSDHANDTFDVFYDGLFAVRRWENIDAAA